MLKEGYIQNHPVHDIIFGNSNSIANNPNLHDDIYNDESNLPIAYTDKDIMLGIESSCDDTGVALVQFDGTILSEILMSQIGIHEQ